MQNLSLFRRKKFKEIYDIHVDNIYKICFFYLRDESVAQMITEQVFVEYYKEFDRIDSNCVQSYLIRKAKYLSLQKKDDESAGQEV